MPQDSDKIFNSTVETVNNFSEKQSDEDMKIIYGLYKQATIGDCNINKPGMFDFKGKAKWDTWNERKGMTSEESKIQYVNHVKEMLKNK